MPELPDVVVYLECLAPRILGRPLERVTIVNPFVLRTVEPPIAAAEGRRVTALRRLGKRLVAMEQFEQAKDRVIMGTEWKSLVMTDDEKRMTAYHEAGHALVRTLEPASDPIHKATIIPRGFALRCRWRSSGDPSRRSSPGCGR